MSKELGDLAEKTFWHRIEFSDRFLDRKLLGDEAQWVEKDSETGSGAKSGEWSFKFNLNCLNCLNWLKCLKRLPGSRAAGTAKISKWFGFSEFCRRLLVFDVTVVCLYVHAASHSLTA